MKTPARITATTAAPTLREPHVRRIAAAAEASHSPATLRNYRAAWGRFVQWCDREGLDPLPAAPESVAAYLAERAEDRSLATVRLDRFAVRWAHESAGHPSPAGHAGVRRVVKGLTRTAARNGRAATRQAAPLTASALAAITATAQRRRTGPTGHTESRGQAFRRGLVDIALASVMRDALLRRSEAAALRWADVELRSDGSARVTVRRSKTDQQGEGAVQYIGPMAAAALREIQPREAFSGRSRVFCLKSGRAVSNRIAAAAKAAGLDGAFSGHSPRVGMAVDLVRAGHPTAAVQVAGRWASDHMPALHTRGETAARGAVASYYGR